MYEAFVIREVAEELIARKHAELGGIWANTNMDPDEKDRHRKEKILRDIENAYDDALRSIHASGGSKGVQEQDPFERDPLYAAIRRPDGSERLRPEERERLQREFLEREEERRMMEERSDQT